MISQVIDGIEQNTQQVVQEFLNDNSKIQDDLPQFPDQENYQQDQQDLDQLYDTVQSRNPQMYQEENPYVLHIRSLQRSAKYNQNVLKKMEKKIKECNERTLEQNKLLTQFQKFREKKSKANCREIKKQIKVAKLEVENYQLQVSEVKQHIKKLTKFERINQLNLKLKQREFQIMEMQEKKSFLTAHNRNERKKLKNLKKSKQYFSEATHSLNQQYIYLKTEKVDRLQDKVRQQNKRIEGMRQMMKFKQQESKQLLENIIELETSYRELCSQFNIKTKNQYLKSPFNKLQGPLTTRTPRLKSSRKYLKSIEKTAKQASRKVTDGLNKLDDLANLAEEAKKKAEALMSDRKSSRPSNRSSRNSNRSEIKDKIENEINTFITGAKKFSFNDKTKGIKTEILDEKVKYQKEVRDLMKQLKEVYQQQDNIRYNQQSQIKEKKREINEKEKLIQQLEKEDTAKIKESLEKKLQSLEENLDLKREKLIVRNEHLLREKEQLIDQQTQHKYNMEQKQHHFDQLKLRNNDLMQGIINPEPFLTTKQQVIYNQVRQQSDDYVKISKGDFDPETFLFSDEKFLGFQIHFKIKSLKIKAYGSYIIFIQTTYTDLKTGKDYIQTNRKGDIPKDCVQIEITLAENEKIYQILLQKDENNFIRHIEIQTTKQIKKIGQIEGIPGLKQMTLGMSHEEQRQIYEMFCLYGAFQSLIKKGLNKNLVVLTGIGMCFKKDLEIEEQILNDMIKRLIFESALGAEIEQFMRMREVVHWSRDQTKSVYFEDALRNVYEIIDDAYDKSDKEAGTRQKPKEQNNQQSD